MCAFSVFSAVGYEHGVCATIILRVKFALAPESLATHAVNTNYNMLSDDYKPSLNKQQFLLAPLCPAIPLHQFGLSSLVVFHSLFTLDRVEQP